MRTCKHPTCPDSGCRRPVKPRKRYVLPSIAKKREQVNRLYSARRIAFLKANPVCIVCGGRAADIHHAKGRGMKFLMDESTWKPVCRPDHRKIELNPLWARKMGFSQSRLS